jgi:hypothetical protein
MGILESAAGIAAAILALIGVGYKIADVIKRKAIEAHKQEGRSIEQQILEATTNEERARLVRLFDQHNS